jgi:hypothetical protein
MSTYASDGIAPKDTTTRKRCTGKDAEEAVIVKAIPQHLPGGSKDNQKKPHSRQSMFQPISKPDNSCTQGRSNVTGGNMLVTSSSLVVILFHLIPFMLKRAVGSSKTPSFI